jgi:predicted DsbA family dithiol-disulfide isomerase
MVRVRVEGVPSFNINRTITLSGARQPDAFLEAFGRAVGPR